MNISEIYIIFLFFDQVWNSLEWRFLKHEKLFKSINIINPTNFVIIANFRFLTIENNLVYLVIILVQFNTDITVGRWTK